MSGQIKKALAVSAALALSGALQASNVKQGNDAPNVSGTWLNHESTNLKDLRGYAVLLDFWGTH
jgi:hypothetical protein